MTYCLAINLNQGLVFCSDSRTNAGMDNISTYSKMHTFVWPGNRVFVLLSAGNLAITQAVVKRMNRDVEQSDAPSLLSLDSMHEAADYVGLISTDLQRQHASRDTASTNFLATTTTVAIHIQPLSSPGAATIWTSALASTPTNASAAVRQQQ